MESSPINIGRLEPKKIHIHGKENEFTRSDTKKQVFQNQPLAVKLSEGAWVTSHSLSCLSTSGQDCEVTHVTEGTRVFSFLQPVDEKESSSCHVETLTMERFLRLIIWRSQKACSIVTSVSLGHQVPRSPLIESRPRATTVLGSLHPKVLHGCCWRT